MLRTGLLFLFLFTGTLLYALDPVTRFPQCTESFLLFRIAPLQKLPFADVFEKNTILGNIEQNAEALAPFHADPGIQTAAVLYAGDDCVFLLKSPLTPGMVRQITEKKLLGGNGAAPETFTVGEITCLRFREDQQEELPSGLREIKAAVIAFTGKEECMIGPEKTVRRFLASPKGLTPELKHVFAALRKEYAACGILQTKEISLVPGIQHTKAVAFSFSRMEGLPSPVTGELLLFPSAQEKYAVLHKSARDFIANAYRTAGKQGPISPEMRYAFQVMPAPGFVRIDAALTDENAKDFFRLLLEQLK